MKKNIVITLIIGISLIGFVIFKNIHRLNQRIEDNAQLAPFENDLLTIQLPKNLVHERDTTFLETGELINTVEGVSGSLWKHGRNKLYALSVATYNRDFTTNQSFHLDSLKNYLSQMMTNSDLKLLSIDTIELQGYTGLRYIGRNSQDFEQRVIFSVDNNVILINSKGQDSLDLVFESILKSIKIKK